MTLRNSWEKKPRPSLLGALSLTLSLGLISACSKSSGSPQAARVRPPPLVVVSKVTVQDVALEVRAPVELHPFAQADVGSKTLGYLDAVLVDRGDKVRRGQLVALVRPSDLPDQLAAARGTLSQMGASVALARTNLERAQALAPKGVISQQDLSQATANLATTLAQEEAARAQVGALATRVGETKIEAPLDGVVAIRRLDPGALVGPSGAGAIVTIVRTDVLRVFISVPERQIEGLAVGKDAHVEVDALPGKSLPGKVVRIAPTLDPSTRTLDAEVQLANPNGELRPGMFGRGSIVIETHRNVPYIPATSIQLSNGERFVYVALDEQAGSATAKVSRRKVTTGVDNGAWIEVTSGLREGDALVTAGIDGLSDGTTVRLAHDVNPFTGEKRDKAGQPSQPSQPSPASSAKKPL